MENSPHKTEYSHRQIIGNIFQFLAWFAVFLFLIASTASFFGVFRESPSSFSDSSERVLASAVAPKKVRLEVVGAKSNSSIKTLKIEKVPNVPTSPPTRITPVAGTPKILAQSAGAGGTAVFTHDAGSEAPLRIVIGKIGVDAEVENPQKKANWVLDAALQKGAVRYPDSALLGEKGNVLLFGHSSHLKVVYNHAYRSFNELGSLLPGDEVTVYSASKVYVYKVSTVTLLKDSEARVDLLSTTPKLTLVTCNNFGAKEDRYVVEANLLTSYSINNV